MPNGGSDCCGTCWFNSSNEGKAGSHGARKNEVVRCVIRDLIIKDPFWTYCANHPHHTKKMVSVPIGPVYVNDGYPYSRKLWVKAPDTEAIRLTLLDYLAGFDMQEELVYPTPTDFEAEVIKQLQDYKEKRALPLLKRLIGKDFNRYSVDPGMPVRNKAIIVGLATEALLEISAGEEIEAVKHLLTTGTEHAVDKDYHYDNDNFAVIRYHFVRGLRWVKPETAAPMLRKALEDPHPEIRAFAQSLNDKA